MRPGRKQQAEGGIEGRRARKGSGPSAQKAEDPVSGKEGEKKWKRMNYFS